MSKPVTIDSQILDRILIQLKNLVKDVTLMKKTISQDASRIVDYTDSGEPIYFSKKAEKRWEKISKDIEKGRGIYKPKDDKDALDWLRS